MCYSAASAGDEEEDVPLKSKEVGMPFKDLVDPTTSSCSCSSSIVCSAALSKIEDSPISTTDSHCAKSSTVLANSEWVPSCELMNAPKSKGRIGGPVRGSVADDVKAACRAL